MEKLIRFFKDEEGATAVEYGLIVALIAAVIVTIVATLGGQIQHEPSIKSRRPSAANCQLCVEGGHRIRNVDVPSRKTLSY